MYCSFRIKTFLVKYVDEEKVEVQILDESEVIGFFSNPVCPLCPFELSTLAAFAVCKTLDKMFEVLFNISRNSPTMVCT